MALTSAVSQPAPAIPLPHARPLHLLPQAVEPVVDSSRYFVVRLVDRAAPRKHAFIGLGFR
jgi:hypothetical protein